MEGVSRLYLDTNIFIRMVEYHDELASALTDLLVAQDSGEPFLVTSELTLLEALVAPYRERNDLLISRYDALLLSNNQLEVAPVTRDVLLYAAVLRSQHSGLKAPDAIHLSTAVGMKCSHFLTADKRLTGSYQLTLTRWGQVRGSVEIEVLRPEPQVVQQLTEKAAQ